MRRVLTFVVPNVFHRSHQVPNITTLYLICFAQSLTLVTYMCILNATTTIYICDCPIKVAITKEKEKTLGSPQLITSMNHTKLNDSIPIKASERWRYVPKKTVN